MQKRRRPRALTLTLPDSKQPVLVLGGERYTLRNFSQEGIGLWVPPPAPFGMNRGQRISGDIVIGSNIYPVQLEIAHTDTRTVGLKIVHKSPDLTEIFRLMLEPASHACDLMPHAGSGTEDPKLGYPRLWYAGGRATELLVWYNAGSSADHRKMIVALQLCWLGKWVFREHQQPVQTGHLKDGFHNAAGFRVSPDELLKNHEEADQDLMHQAAQFLVAVPRPLPGYLLWQFLETGEQVYLSGDLIPRVA